MKSVLLGLIVVGEALALASAGFLTLWWSSDLMSWLIWKVGAERALGVGNVIYTEGGGVLLTNPGAMMLWTLPFWGLGVLQIGAASTLIGLWLSRREPAPRPGDSPPPAR